MASRDVYVIPSRKCSNRSFYRLSKRVAYGLVSAGVKPLQVSDTEFHDMDLSSVAVISQLFTKSDANGLNMMIAKIVHKLLIIGKRSFPEQFFPDFNSSFKLIQ